MAIPTLDAQRFVANRRASVGQSLRSVTRDASEFLVISIQLKSRVLLMVKDQLAKTVTNDMTLGTVHPVRWTELTDVGIPMTRLAVSADRPREGSVELVRRERPRVAIGALSPRVSSLQFVSRPQRVIESSGAGLLKTFRGVAPRSTL